ncbi:hypothetical protein [Agrobacterium sp. 22-226-1]
MKVIIETRTFGFERITSKVVVPERLTRKAASACETALQAQDYKRHYAENAHLSYDDLRSVRQWLPGRGGELMGLHRCRS